LFIVSYFPQNLSKLVDTWTIYLFTCIIYVYALFILILICLVFYLFAYAADVYFLYINICSVNFLFFDIYNCINYIFIQNSERKHAK